MEFVTIGNPGNAADTTGAPNPAGKVRYSYDIGKFEVSRFMIEQYNSGFGVANGLEITLDQDFMNEMGYTNQALPATGVSWNNAARFVNWLNTSTGGFNAYKFTTGGSRDNISLWTPEDLLDYDPNNFYRSKRARYVLPNNDEWYKAAYYNPNDSLYYLFPGMNISPTPVRSGTADRTAVYNHSYFGIGPADVTQAGGLSPFGVMAMAGNVLEWVETAYDLKNDSALEFRTFRGGGWFHTPQETAKTNRSYNFATGGGDIGFRVVSLPSSAPPAVPEPSMMVIGTLFGLGGLVAKTRMKK
jgi:formylglycine-generating enzyme required for sulfatase activity